MQLPHARLDEYDGDILAEMGLREEATRSRVYDREVKRRLIDIFHQMVKFCSILTDLLSIIGCSNNAFEAPVQVTGGSVGVVKWALESWHGQVLCQFPECKHQYQSDAITIYSNWLHMLYQ